MRIPKTIGLLACLLLSTAIWSEAYSQTGYVWAEAICGPGWYDFGLDAVCDAQGRIFIAGDYEGPSDFGGTTYNAFGSSDMYACRLDATGAFEWVSLNGTGDTERNFSIRVGQDQHIYTCGYGKIPFPRVEDRSMHAWDAITMRTRPDGTVQWGRAMQGDIFSEAYDVAPDAAGNSYTVGQLQTVGWYGTDTLHGHGIRDGYIVKLDSLGNYIWGMTVGGNLNDVTGTVDVDLQGNIWMGGSFEAVGHIGSIVEVSTGGTDGFIAKLDPNGNVLFVKTFTGTGNCDLMELGISADGDCYFTGTFAGTIDIGSQSFTSVDSLADMFYGKLDAAGNFTWGRQAGGTDADFMQDMEVDAEENLYFGGFFYESLIWQGTTEYGSGFDDLFFAKTDSNGTLDFLEVSLGAYPRDVFGLTVDPAQNVIVTGSYSDTMTLGSSVLPASGFNTEIFIAKYATRVQELAVVDVIGTPYCVSDQFLVAFDAWGSFGAGNIFSLELSDLNGSFANPTVIGSVAGMFGDTIVGTIPPGIVAGTHYRMRIAASIPATVSPDNGFDIALDPNTSIPVQISGDTVLCNGQPVVLSIASGFIHQVWSTGDTINTVTITQPGTIWVEATDSNGCTNYDEVEVTTCVSAAVPSLPSFVNILPNPASDAIALHFHGVRPGTFQLALFDGLGRRCLQESVVVGTPQAVIPISLENLPRGIYFLNVYNADAQCQLRLVLQ